MSDPLEPFGRRRKSGETQPKKADKTLPEDRDSPTADYKPASSEEVVAAVSNQLSAHGDILSRPPRKPSIRLADLAGSLGERGKRLENPPGLRASLEMPGTSIEPPLVQFPEADETDRSTEREANCGQSTQASTHAAAGNTLEAATPSSSRECSPSRVETTISSDRAVSPGLLSVGKDETSCSRSMIPAASSIDAGGSRGNPGQGDHRLARGASSIDVTVSRLDSTRVVSGDRPTHPAETMTDSAINRFRGDASEEGPENARPGREAGRDRSNLMSFVGDRSGPARSIDPAVSSVRNPLSDGLRNFSMADSEALEENGASSGSALSESSQSASSSGAGLSMSEGGSMDLTKTNELLQQLVDAVRKQRPSSMPLGSPPVYSDR